MGTTRAFLAGTAIGAGAMYFFDPRMGSRRRAMFEDQMRRLSRQASCGCDTGMRDLGNRTQGVLHDFGELVQHGRWPIRQHRGQRSGWSPAARLIAATCGGALMANCLARRTPGAILLGTLGFGLFARSMASGPKGIHIQRTIEIHAPVEKVYDFFWRPENYPRISDVIANVELFGNGRFAKDMLIAGVPYRFEERFYRCEKNHVLESRSEPDSAMRYCKQMIFEDVGDGWTRLHAHFNYHPPGGTLGHAFASVIGIDPKSILIDLLMRTKFYLETGREPHDALGRRKAKTTADQPTDERQQGERLMHGPGAPTDDVLRPSIRETGHPATWPPPANWLPESPEPPLPQPSSAQFPTPMD
jgi:uncharacterized membrane protein